MILQTHWGPHFSSLDGALKLKDSKLDPPKVASKGSTTGGCSGVLSTLTALEDTELVMLIWTMARERGNTCKVSATDHEKKKIYTTTLTHIPHMQTCTHTCTHTYTHTHTHTHTHTYMSINLVTVVNRWKHLDLFCK